MKISSEIVSAQLALFANRIDNYIFAQKLSDAEGSEVEIDDTPAYKFTASDARLFGGEARVDVHPLPRLHIGNSFSYVNSVQLHQHGESNYLPLAPAPRWNADARYEFVCNGNTLDNMFLKVAMDCNLRQNHFFAAYGTETVCTML